MEFNPMLVKEYRLIGYENRILNNNDFTNDAVDAGDLGSGHNVTALYEIVPNLDKTEMGVLKYDATDITPSKLEDNEWLYVKIRYKDPDDSVSKLIIHKLDNSRTNNPSSNFYFSAAVVEFAMLLHNSVYKGAASFIQVKELLTKYSDNDTLGYKKEFFELVKMAEQLSETTQGKK
jgi:Ca-activated chloride channel family protein